MKLNKLLLPFLLIPTFAFAGAYTPVVWEDDGGQAINAEQMNRIDNGVDSAHSEIDAHTVLIAGMEDALTCSDTQIKKWSGGLWACATDEIGAGDIEGVTAGTGLTGGGTSGTVTINADVTYLQRRVFSECAAGSSIRIIDEDGTVTCETDDAGAGVVPSGDTDGQMLIWDQTGTQAWIVVSELTGIGLNLNSDESNLLWATGTTYRVHLAGIFEPIDATILKDADIGVNVASESGDVNTIEFVYSDVSATDTGKNLRIPTGSAWVNAYSWCDGAEAVLVYDVQYSATLGGSFASAGTIAHDAAATTDTVDISGWTDAAAGSWIHVDIQTAGTTATVCTLAIQLENN